MRYLRMKISVLLYRYILLSTLRFQDTPAIMLYQRWHGIWSATLMPETRVKFLDESDISELDYKM